jgi:aminocarboxymuconate-semialdehyde decarboxylase
VIIDIHAHIVDRKYYAHLAGVGDITADTLKETGQTFLKRQGITVAWSREEMFSIESRLREMDRLGIDKRVLSLSAPNVYEWTGKQQIEITREINDALAAACRAHPDRFVGLGSLPLDDPDAALKELDRCIDELGFRGLAIGSSIGKYPVNHPRFEPVWSRINRQKLPVFEHPMLPLSIEV